MPKELWYFLIPLILIQVTFQVIAIIGLIKRPLREVRFQNKLIWGVIIVVGAILGTAAYFIFGGITNEEYSSED